MGPSPHTSWLRRHRLLLALVFLPVAIVAIGEVVGWPFLKGPAQDLLTRRMERPVRIAAPFRVRFLGRLRLHADGLWVAAPEEFATPHFLDAQGIDIKFRYRDLWRFYKAGKMRIAAIEVDRVDARLLRSEDGDATWRFGKRDPRQPRVELPAVDLLAVRQGSLVFRDPALAADFRAAFDTREGAGSPAAATHLQVRGQFRGRPLSGELASSGWLPATTQGAGAPPPVTAQGWLTYGPLRADFEGNVKDLFGRRDIAGNVTVKGPSLAVLGQLLGSTLPTTSPFVLQGRIEKQKDLWRVDAQKARIGDSHLAASFTYDTAATPPHLEGDLKGSNLVLADLGPALGTRSEEGKPFPRRPGHVIPSRPLDIPSLRSLTAHLTVNLDRVDLGKAFREPIQPFKAILTLEQGRLGLAKVDARTARGRLTGDISVDGRQKTPLWQADLSWEGIRLEDWLRGAKDREQTAKANGESRPPYFTGALLGRAKLAGQGHSTAEVLASLDGEVTLSVRNGTLSHLVVEVLGLDVAQGLGLYLGRDESLPMQCAVMDLQARNGVLAPKVALVDTPVTLILADGTVNLANESLNLRLTAEPKNVSPFTVRSPIRVRGNFEDPQAKPESGPIAARVLGGVALAFVNPLAAIIPFLDPGGASGSPCVQALASLKRR